jgi:hypothetical protein
MSSDIFTKNVGGQDFCKHRDKYVRENPSVQQVGATTTSVPVGEGVEDRVYPGDAGTGQMQGTGPPAVEVSTGVTGGVNEGVSDLDDTSEEHVASVVAAREDG